MRGYVMVTAQEYDTLMSYTQLTPGEISQAFGLGSPWCSLADISQLTPSRWQYV
ncbi:hypothetical protein [Vibrio alginolyticus]|uniref:hypothetical protein n=1 Tax=Vibrio alginolyticus TaxID=663 RepID=UPI001D04A719|nr:hypothetical protein [Vibrio alginolyticus]